MIIPEIADALVSRIVGVDVRLQQSGRPCSVCGIKDGLIRHGDELLCSACTAWNYNTTHGLPSPWLKETIR